MRFNVAGDAYEQDSVDLNAQKTVNLYPVIDNTQAKNIVALMPTPGLTALMSSSYGVCRGLIEFEGNLFGVFGDSFVSIEVDAEAKSATETLIDTLQTSGGRVYLSKNTDQIIISDGPNAYIYTVATAAFSQVTDADYSTSTGLVFIDGYFVFSRANSGVMFHSGLYDGNSYDPLDFATAESETDFLVTIASDKGELWAFGEKSVEVWYNAANATGFVFSPRPGGVINQGCAAARSVTRVDNSIAWLDDRRYIVVSTQYNVRVLSTRPLNREIAGYGDVSDANFYSYSDQGHLFLVCSFPSVNKTWVYDFMTDMWHERSTLISGKPSMHLGQEFIRHKDLNIVSSWKDGDLYYYNNDSYTDDGGTVERLRVTSHFGEENKRFAVHALELYAESGVGLVSGDDPTVELFISKDGGHTYGNPQARSLGKIGNYDHRVRWNRLGTSREWTFKFRVTDPVKVVFIDGYLDVGGGI